MYLRMLEDVTQRGDMEMLAEMHSLSIAVKVKSSTDCVGGIEEARGTMGGHGYSYMSGIGPLFANAVPTRTYEGPTPTPTAFPTHQLTKNRRQLRNIPTNLSIPPKTSVLPPHPRRRRPHAPPQLLLPSLDPPRPLPVLHPALASPDFQRLVPPRKPALSAPPPRSIPRPGP